MMSPKKNPKNIIIFRAVKTVWRAKSSLSRALYSEKYLAIAVGIPDAEMTWNIPRKRVVSPSIPYTAGHKSDAIRKR